MNLGFVGKPSQDIFESYERMMAAQTFRPIFYGQATDQSGVLLLMMMIFIL